VYFDFNLLTVFGTIVVAVLLALVITRPKARRNRIIEMGDTSLTCEELEDHAKKMAVEHSVSRKKRIKNWPVPRLNDNYNFILSVYKSLSDDVQKKLTIPPGTEWLLDNFYIIEEQVKSLRREMSKEIYMHLPVLKCGQFKGHARILAIALELVSHTDGQIDESIILNYLKAYQSHSILSDREIWAAPIMIRIALIENIRHICERLKDTQNQWRKADDIADELFADEELDNDSKISAIRNKIRIVHETSPSFIEHISYRFRRAGRGYVQALRYIDENLARYGTTLEEIRRKEHNSQAAYAVSMGNCVSSLKLVLSVDWIDIFESTSRVEQILREDPDGTYPLMDLPSRNYYRNRVEEIASAYNISGIHVAREAIGLAKSYCLNMSNSTPDNNTQNNDKCFGHVGYYLVGKGIKGLTDRLGNSSGKVGKTTSDIAGNHHLIIYLGSIILLTLLLSLIAVYYSASNAISYSVILSLITLIAVFVPASEIAVNIVNRIVCNMKKPTVFPRLELKEGIPENLSTMVVVPTLLPDEKRVGELLENLEMHYLANKEKNLFFSLLGDFKDSPESSKDNDEKIINAAMEGVNRLNKKYAADGQDIFYFFHRKRIFNKSQNKWMGWERKRGAIIEFNDLLLGSKETSFSYFSHDTIPSDSIKYVITLDADTILPRGGAKKMIGTMAHPLNKPIIDKNRGIVVEGYGLVQPRISFDIESSNKSLFSRIFTGQEGIDPYASAISDVYQDLFGEGIFTGKGIYDLKVFQSLLRDAIPENSILSHDLLEGSYVRTGLVTDLELIDSYPTKYNSYASRLHRWVRGDWQLLPWIFGMVYDRQGRRIKNPLNALSKWKIIDNMRRSLVMPFLMLIVVLGFSVLPGSALFWLGVSLLTLAFPLIASGIDYIVKGSFMVGKIKHHIPVISGMKATFLQIVLMFLFIPYQAYLMANAIIVTLSRVLFTRKGMLEWVTAADVEKGAKNSLESYYWKMKSSIFLAVIVVILAFTFKSSEAGLSLLLLGIWSLSPFVAYHISKASEEAFVALPFNDIRELRRIARKTWRYFEEFVNFKNHFLVPDNYQEDPSRGIAYRTSPTNIGLGMLSILTARDFGYIGTFEMVDIIYNTVSTVEKMEKWNGHLFNWYDTRTLRPLKPRYVSTVDSGNFVGYLITLIHGLNEYLESPLVDTKLVDGIQDTLDLANLDNLDIKEKLDLLHKAVNAESVDLSFWGNALNSFYDGIKGLAVKRSTWKAKVEKMVRMLKRELDEFMLWLDVFSESPDMSRISSVNDNIFQVLENIKSSLNGCAPLKDMPAKYKNAINSIEEAIGLMKSCADDFSTEQSWFKGEMVPEKDDMDFTPTGRYMANNPYKTPPNKR
jgi:cyclic beta-1,2-glucan synthetase